MSSKLSNIPVFKLYGEQSIWATPDLLHCESIAQRSSLHQWEIKPHRHADLFQLLYLQQGEAVAEVEQSVQRLKAPSLQVIPPLCVHGFRFTPEAQGYVLTLATPLLTPLEAHLGYSLSHQTPTSYHPTVEDRLQLDLLFATLCSEYKNTHFARELQLQALVTQLLVWWVRQAQRQQEALQPQARNSRYLRHFMQLVEQEYRTHPRVEDLAHRIGISAAHLNSLCRTLAGQTALHILHQRLLLEAKRYLLHTQINVSDLADELGFNDAAYFARFFRRLAGTSPSDFRNTAAFQTIPPEEPFD